MTSRTRTNRIRRTRGLTSSSRRRAAEARPAAARWRSAAPGTTVAAAGPARSRSLSRARLGSRTAMASSDPAGPRLYRCMIGRDRFARRAPRFMLAPCCRERYRPAAVSSLRRSAGRSGVRLHPRRDDLVALLGARLDHPRASPSQPVPDSGDRAGRRRDDLRGGDARLRRALRHPGAGDGRARLPFPAARDRRLGRQLHRGRRRTAGRALGRGAGAAARARRRAGGAARRRREIARLSALVRRPARGALSRPRGLSPRDARLPGADRDRGGAAGREPRAHRRGDARAGRSDGRGAARACSRSISARSGCSASTPRSWR